MKQHQPPPHEDDSVFPLEEKLGHALVKARLLSDSQLKTAFDYQHSLGGSLLEVVEKLGFVSPKALARFVADQKLKGPVQDRIPPAAPTARDRETASKLVRRAPPPPPAEPDREEPEPERKDLGEETRRTRAEEALDDDLAGQETPPPDEAPRRGSTREELPEGSGEPSLEDEPVARTESAVEPPPDPVEDESPGEPSPEVAPISKASRKGAPREKSKSPEKSVSKGRQAVPERPAPLEKPALEEEPKPQEAPASQGMEKPGLDTEMILRALIQILIKKGVFRRRELEEMIRAECEALKN